MAAIGAGYYIVEKGWALANDKLNNSTFTIYAFHILPLQIFLAANFQLLRGRALASYTLSIIEVIILSYLLNIIINKSKVSRALLNGR